LIEDLPLCRIVLDDARTDGRERCGNHEPDRAVDDEILEVRSPAGIARE